MVQYINQFLLFLNFLSGHPLVYDVDLDGDLEIFVGTTNGMVGVDLKDVGGDYINYWHQYRNGLLRNGYIESDQLLNNDINQHPENFMLFNPYPNPFNPSTSISYFIKEASDIQITIHDITGRKVATLLEKFQQKDTILSIGMLQKYLQGNIMYILRQAISNYLKQLH